METRINAFHKLGSYLRAFLNNDGRAIAEDQLAQWTDQYTSFNKLQDKLVDYIEFSNHYNAWFTRDNVLFALNDWADALTNKKLHNWLDDYQLGDINKPKTIGVVMAGNLPMVGFHDYLSVLMSGHYLQAKLSSDDAVLIPLLHEMLSLLEPSLAQAASFTKDQLKNFDAIIATGSNNTSRYFEYYFGKYPHIIRKNRSGVAILNGDESKEQLCHLAVDLTAYFGLGCRSVSKLYIPKDYEFKALFKCLDSFDKLAQHHKYFNNYEYNKAIYLVNRVPHRDTGFMLFKEDSALSSPISVVYFEEYANIDHLEKTLNSRKNEIQCILDSGKHHIPFGQSQHPQLSDYADGVDTIAFLGAI